MTGSRFDDVVAALSAALTRRRLAGSVGLLLVGLRRGAAPVAAGPKPTLRHSAKNCPTPFVFGSHCCGLRTICFRGQCVDRRTLLPLAQ